MPALPPDFDRKLRRLHKQGLSANAIAKRLGCAVSTVSKHAKDLGLSFARTGTAAAVEAHAIDLKARRQKIVDRLYSRAEHVLGRLEAETYVYTIAIAGQGTERVDDVEPPAHDERNLGNAISGYLVAAAKLEAIDADSGEAEVKSMLQRLGEELGIRP